MKINKNLFIISVLFLFLCNTLNAAEWYKPDTRYYKISTAKDGIARLDFSQLLLIAPELQGKSPDGLHLFFRGESCPLYYYGSDVISSQSNLLFFGRRAAGDTTFFDNYTAEAVFFLYYDEDVHPDRMAFLSEPAAADKALESVLVERHYEKNVEFFPGFDVLNVETDKFENWYWKILNDYPGAIAKPELEKCVFDDNFIFFPDITDSRSITVTPVFSVNYAYANTWNDPKYHRIIKSMINTDTLQVADVDTWVENYPLTMSIAPKNMFFGANKLEVINITADNINTEIGIDYYKVSGYSLPFAYKSDAVFSTSEIYENKFIKINGFSDSTVAIYDTLSKSIVIKKASPRTRIAAGVSNSGNNIASLMINDEVYTYTTQGFHIGILYPGGNTTAEFQFSREMGKDIENILSNITGGSVVVVAYNGDKEIPAYLKNWLAAAGSKQINNVKVNDTYLFAFKSGSSEAAEKYATSELLTLQTSFHDEYRRSFSLEFKIAPKPDYHFSISDMKGIEVAGIQTTQPTDLHAASRAADMIIISHPKFYNAAGSIAEYRSNQGYRVELVNVDEVYKEFGYGVKSPHAIKDFLKFAYQNWTAPAPKYVLFIGDASLDPNMNHPNSIAVDYIPTYGYPYSDYWFGVFDSTQPRNFQLIVGRIPVNNESEVLDYLNKVKAYEAAPVAPWHKRFLFLNGGNNKGEMERIVSDSYMLSDILTDTPLCIDTVRINRENPGGSPEAQKGQIISAINNGVAFTIYNGHAAPEVFDFDGWHVQNLSNKESCGILTTLSCNSGAFAEPTLLRCRNEEYIVAKDKGFVAAIGSTTVGEMNSNFALTKAIFESLVDSVANIRNIGDLLYAGKSKMADIGRFSPAMRYFVTLLGDPLIRIKIDTLPDLYLQSSDVAILSNNEKKLIKETDETAEIAVWLHNAGYSTDENFNVKLEHTYQGSTTAYIKEINGLCKDEARIFSVPVKGLSGEHIITFRIDEDKIINENIRTNNVLTTKFYVYKSGLLPVEPLAYWNMKSSSMRFRQINALYGTGSFQYEFKIIQIKGEDTLLIKLSSYAEIKETENYIDWVPDVSLTPNSSYIFVSQLIDAVNGNRSEKLFVPFNTRSYDIDDNALYGLQTSAEFASMSLDDMMVSADGDNARIGLQDNDFNYEIISCNGGAYNRFCRISLADSLYIDGGINNRGFNIVIVNRHEKNPTGKYYWYDTWEDTGNISKTIALLSDSVKDSDYVLLGVADQALYKLTAENMDTLKKLLQGLGSKYAESLAWNSSIALIGYRGAEIGSIPEATATADTAKISGELKFHLMQGTAATMPIGPANHWKSISIDGDISGANSESEIKITGIDKDQKERELLKKIHNGVIDISAISAQEYPYIKVFFTAKRSDVHAMPHISKITANFTPAAELAYLTKSHIAPNPAMRADSATLHLDIENISVRSKSIPAKINAQINGQSAGTSSTQTLELPAIMPDLAQNFMLKFDTEFLEAQNIINFDIDAPQNNNELYTFNNIFDTPFNVYEDTIRPTMEVRIDGDLIANGDYITNKPTVEVRLFDNSRLAITADEPIIVRVNAYPQTKLNSEYQLEKYPAGSELKAKLTVKPEQLPDYNEHLFMFTCVDASGNRDTLQYRLLISLNGFLENLKVFPHPVNFGNDMNFGFYFIAADDDAEVVIDIFNPVGGKIKTIKTPAKLRNNTVIWDLTDDNGNLISPGTYYYIIKINSEYWVEPGFGKFIFTK